MLRVTFPLASRMTPLTSPLATSRLFRVEKRVTSSVPANVRFPDSVPRSETSVTAFGDRMQVVEPVLQGSNRDRATVEQARDPAEQVPEQSTRPPTRSNVKNHAIEVHFQPEQVQVERTELEMQDAARPSRLGERQWQGHRDVRELAGDAGSVSVPLKTPWATSWFPLAYEALDVEIARERASRWRAPLDGYVTEDIRCSRRRGLCEWCCAQHSARRRK
jgi:hypothetical protein